MYRKCFVMLSLPLACAAQAQDSRLASVAFVTNTIARATNDLSGMAGAYVTTNGTEGMSPNSAIGSENAGNVPGYRLSSAGIIGLYDDGNSHTDWAIQSGLGFYMRDVNQGNGFDGIAYIDPTTPKLDLQSSDPIHDLEGGDGQSGAQFTLTGFGLLSCYQWDTFEGGRDATTIWDFRRWQGGTFHVASTEELAQVQAQIPPTNGILYEAKADLIYARSNGLADVAWNGRYSSLTNTPVVLASNGIARASHAWGVGYGGWTGWTASNIVLTASNAVLTGCSGGYLETTGLVTGIVSVAQSALGTGGYSDDAVIYLSFDDGLTWNPISALPPKSERTGGTKLRVQVGDTPGIPGSTPTWTLSSIVCDTWIDSSRAAEVFPLHAVSVQVDIPSDPLDVANKAYVDTVSGLAQETADRALEWWNIPARGDAYMDGHRLHLGGGWSILGDTGSFAALSNDGSVGLGVIGDSAQFSVQLANENILIARFDTAMMQITAWSGAASNMWISVSTNGLSADSDSSSAWVEYSASLDSGVWARAPIQNVALPTNTATFRIAFQNPRWGETNGFFRVMQQSGSLAALRSMVPLRAPSMMISESNSVAVSTHPGVITIDSIAAAPAAIVNHAQLYSVLGELWTMDGDGNATRLSTHDGPLWVARSCNVYTGWGTTIDMVSGNRTRFRLSSLRSWDADQKAIETAQNEAIKRWQETPANKRRTPRPFSYVAQPEPAWMKEQRLAKDDPQPIK